MTVYGYTRVSTAEQAADDRTSLETQRRKIAAAAELSGLTWTPSSRSPVSPAPSRWPHDPRVVRCSPGCKRATR